MVRRTPAAVPLGARYGRVRTLRAGAVMTVLIAFGAGVVVGALALLLFFGWLLGWDDIVIGAQMHGKHPWDGYS